MNPIEEHGLTEELVLPNGLRLANVHAKDRCEGRACVVHNPSAHRMRSFPLQWRDDACKFVRVCPHGIGHPDPDDLAFRLSLPTGDDGYAVHGCDGCCRLDSE